MIPTIKDMKWALGISLGNKYYYTPKGREELEMLWAELRERDRETAQREERLRHFLSVENLPAENSDFSGHSQD